MGTMKIRAKGQKIKKLPVDRKVAIPTVLGFRARGNLYLATPQVLAIDWFWGKRYNAESDGAWKSTVPIILTVGSQTKAFSSGSVTGGVRSRNLKLLES